MLNKAHKGLGLVNAPLSMSRYVSYFLNKWSKMSFSLGPTDDVTAALAGPAPGPQCSHL